ncbi:MAG: serine protease [Acidobacteria bacterium]|nr:MAG: serine protease [Acidobacteriota bacterium]PYV30620.1 MAG: serine protease [Acidobacteriota bacterium]
MRSALQFRILLPAFLFGALVPRPAEAVIARIDLNGAIDPITAEFVVKSIDRAEAESAEFLLIRLQTPGGFGMSMEEIISRMLNSKVPVVVYVTPSGAKAASAGFFVLLAADVAVMAPGTNTGAAHPLMAIGGFPVDGGEAAKTLTQKITSNATAFLRSIASKRNRNVAEAEKGVTESKSFTDAEALEKNLIDMVAKDETELLRRLDGYKVHMFSGRERTLRVRDQPVADYEMTTRQKFLSTISQPNLALLLGLAGLILLYFEFSNPGFVAPGVIGAICLLLSILGFSFLPINYVGALLILLAIGLFVAEVKVQGFGILGLGGVVSMVIGMLILVDSPDPALRIGLKTALSMALPFAIIFTILVVAMFKSLKQAVTTGDVGMVGLIGIADTEINSGGRVRVRGEYWAARSSTPIPPGRPVRVIGVDNLLLKVEEVKE